jgi:signal peptidase I
MDIPTFNSPEDRLSEQPTKDKKGKHFLLETLETVGIALSIFAIIYIFIAQPHLVKGESMQPNYHEGEYILTSKLYKWWGEPSRGDVIVLKNPNDRSVQFIKRIIALPGEKIKISNNQITITNKEHPNGYVLKESYISAQVLTAGNAFLSEGEEYQVPEHKYIVMGDNRTQSYDSRSWGSLDKNDIVGKAFFVYWPLPEFGLIAHASYNE